MENEPRRAAGFAVTSSKVALHGRNILPPSHQRPSSGIAVAINGGVGSVAQAGQLRPLIRPLAIKVAVAFG